nr:uncharacterized protein LOC129416586 [Misgurnus anguillicaudatus]
MKILNSEELKLAEITLHEHLPKSLKVYGFVFAINRGKPHTLEVVVDSWPAFTTIIVRPDPNNCRAKDFMKKVTLYTTNEEDLKRMLTVENAIDWNTYFLIGGCDVRHSPMLKEIAASRSVQMKGFSLVHLMILPEPKHLPELSNSDLETKVSVLNASHADVVNKAWKFGGDEKGYKNILNLITHFPTCCITDDNNQPVSWILLYDYCALGILYTQPEHRGKGYAKALVTTMAKRLHSQGYPVYCFIEDCNQLSYKLFTSLGFTEDPSYMAAWYEFITPHESHPISLDALQKPQILNKHVIGLLSLLHDSRGIKKQEPTVDTRRSVAERAMYQLTTKELKTLEVDLKKYFPHSLQVYGYIFHLNRIGQRADPISVFVDHWPEFQVVLIKPDILEKGDHFKDLSVFSKNEGHLRDILAQTDIIHWNTFICLAIDLHHREILETIAANKGVPVNKAAVCRMMVLQEPSKIVPVDSLSLKISSLNESHIALINNTWKFGNEHSIRMIRNMILNFPSCCVLDSDDQPVAWVLTYTFGAMGMLYTIPEHRRKGYAKALVSIMSRRLHSQGYPVYCYIEEENQVSYRLFTNLGFTKDPEYRTTWVVLNDF